MPSPIQTTPKGKFYRRSDGAWVKIKGSMKQVGADKYENRKHFSKRDLKKDRRRRATKSKMSRRYPQAYD